MQRIVLLLALLAASCSGKGGDNGGKTDPCENETCSGHGECMAGVDGRASCECDPGYRSVGLTCVADCFAVDCANNGGCIVVDGEPQCVCNQGYHAVGLECEPAPRTCYQVDCSGHGSCVEMDGQAACICETGYAPFGLGCVPVSCTNVSCSGHGACVVDDGAPSCQCDPGYMTVGLGCVADECRRDACSGHGACALVDGKMECTCDHGYVAVDDECRPEPCAEEDCSNHGACVAAANGVECQCDPGYLAVGLSCRPRCSARDCGGHGTCVQDETAVRCLCDPGYEEVSQRCVASGDGGVAPPDGSSDSGGGDGGSCTEGMVDGGPTGSLQWVCIPGGTFLMGSASGGNSDERPVIEVTVPSFEMLQTEVTVSQYRECVDGGPCTAPGTAGLCNWSDEGTYAEHPVNCVNWEQMEQFCAWVGGRLPSEAQWEYAARSGGQAITYPWGNEAATCDYAVMDDATHSDGCDNGRTRDVCSTSAGNTAHGLCDMAGNVWEWMQDWYHDSYTGAPDNGSAWVVPSGAFRSMRSGSFALPASEVRAAYRGALLPALRGPYVGARCVRDAP